MHPAGSTPGPPHRSLSTAEDDEVDREFGIHSFEHNHQRRPGHDRASSHLPGSDPSSPIEGEARVPTEPTIVPERHPQDDGGNLISCQSSQRTRIGSSTPRPELEDEVDVSGVKKVDVDGAGRAGSTTPSRSRSGSKELSREEAFNRERIIQSDMNDPGQEIDMAGPVGEKMRAGVAVAGGEAYDTRGSEAGGEEGGEVEITEDGYMLTRDGNIIWVDFSLSSPRDPMHFPLFKKYTITSLACIFTLLTSLNLASFAAGEPGMETALNMSALSAAAGLALFAWGFAIFPLVLAPISEQYGRRPVFIVSVVLWWLFYFPIAAGHSGAVVLVFRFLQGGAGSVGATLSSGVVSDVWATSERGSKMSLYALCAVLGSGLAPVFMSWVEQDLVNGWRWVQWIEIIFTGVYVPFVIFFLKETRSSLLLQRAAGRLRKENAKGVKGTNEKSGAGRAGVKYMARSEVDKPKLSQQMKVSCTRPLYLLVTEPVVLFMSIWLGVAWGVLYGELEAIPYVFVTLYDFSHGQTGLVYISLVVGTFMAYFLNFYQERLYKKNVATRGAEARLYLAMAGGIVFAVGAFIFAWTSFSHVHWIAPCIGITIMLCGIFSIYLAVFNYIADSYTVYASSALAAQSFLRNMLAGTFPLWVVQCYEALGINWASTMFGCLAALLAVIPFIAFWYGPRIRARSKFSRKIIEDEERLVEMKVEAMARRKGSGQALQV